MLSRGQCGISINEKPITVWSPDTTYRLDGLFPHSKYLIKIYAKTNVFGRPVEKEVVTESGVPIGYPRGLQAYEPTSTNVKLRWQGIFVIILIKF